VPSSDWIRRHWLKIAVAAGVAFVGGVVWLFEGYEYFDRAVQFFVRWGTTLEPKTNQVTASPAFEAILITAAFVLAGLVGLVIRLLKKSDGPNPLQAVHTELTEHLAKAREMIGGMMAATSKIRNQLSPVGKLVKSFEYARVTYYVYKDFTALVVREYGIRSNKEPVHFWTTGNRASGHADRADYLKDIDFDITDENNSRLPYLPIKNDALAKDVVIYFLPRIEPGEPVRHIKISFKWPRYLRQIEKQGSEIFSFTLDSIDPIPNLEFSWYLEPGTGHKLVGEVLSQRILGDTLSLAVSKQHDGKQWAGFSYTAKQGPSGTFRYELEARLEQA
jgi:hypothetical protein